MKWLEGFTRHARPHRAQSRGLEILKYLGPGILITVGFIDPGNWASNVAAGSQYGYALLWMVTLSTIMLIILQHNVAHLGIVTGYCLSEATERYFSRGFGRFILISSVLAAVSTALAEILGAAIGINMLFPAIPLKLGVVLGVAFAFWMLFGKTYKRLEGWIIGLVSLIGLSFIFELHLVHVDWLQTSVGWVVPAFPAGAIPIIMSVMGAVVMPHNLFLHSEIIQSRQWNLEDDAVIKRQLNYEFLDTLIAMIAGWAINSAMIIVAAATFFANHTVVDELPIAQRMLTPLAGSWASFIFAVALLFSGLSSSVTAGMAGGTIYAGLFKEPYDITDRHTRTGIAITLLGAAVILFFIKDPFQTLIVSQILLSIQLPWTIYAQIRLTSSRKVMGTYANTPFLQWVLWLVAAVVVVLNVWLLWTMIPGH